MDELDLIKSLTKSLPGNASVVVGAGDDCAVLDMGIPDKYVLFKTDAVVEGIHWDEAAKPENIGHKALARNLSDVAAMAGTPTSALVTIGLRREFDAKFVKAVYGGMNALASRYNVAIVGGETTTNPERMFISIALLGTVAKERCILRSGAKAGDGIFVTGELGGSITGKHLTFEPRIEGGLWLAENFGITSMIDLSDGLASDLRHILAASGAGAELLSDAVPISRETKLAAGAKGQGKAEALKSALTDGEDFELLFTVPPKKAVSLLDEWKKKFPKLRLSCIGRITAEAGLRIRDRKGLRALEAHGYVHFKNS